MPVLPFYQFELKDKLNSKPQCFDSFNFLFLLQGTGTIRCRNQLIHLKPHDFTFFNIGSTKAKQYGFLMEYDNGKKLVFAGDEPLKEKVLY